MQLYAMTASNVGGELPSQLPLEASPAAELYGRISADHVLTQALFRQALQDPNGAVSRIVELGQEYGLSVSAQDVRQYVASLEDSGSKQWLMKARGGL